MPVGAALGVAAALFVIGLLYVRRPSHRARRLGRQIAARLRAGASLEDVADRLMELIEREPRDDAARLLVALYLLQTGETLSALLQLAPLRDRHPNSGEVVLLAALAYVNLGRPLDAAALLEVLEVPPDHPWNKEIHRLRRCCRPIRGSGRGLPRPAGTLAPVGSGGESLAD
jgi:Flp pilus assembly protein TadD